MPSELHLNRRHLEITIVDASATSENLPEQTRKGEWAQALETFRRRLFLRGEPVRLFTTEPTVTSCAEIAQQWWLPPCAPDRAIAIIINVSSTAHEDLDDVSIGLLTGAIKCGTKYNREQLLNLELGVPLSFPIINKLLLKKY